MGRQARGSALFGQIQVQGVSEIPGAGRMWVRDLLCTLHFQCYALPSPTNGTGLPLLLAHGERAMPQRTNGVVCSRLWEMRFLCRAERNWSPLLKCTFPFLCSSQEPTPTPDVTGVKPQLRSITMATEIVPKILFLRAFFCQ